jgi:hypothetical protein
LSVLAPQDAEGDLVAVRLLDDQTGNLEEGIGPSPQLDLPSQGGDTGGIGTQVDVDRDERLGSLATIWATTIPGTSGTTTVTRLGGIPPESTAGAAGATRTTGPATAWPGTEITPWPSVGTGPEAPPAPSEARSTRPGWAIAARTTSIPTFRAFTAIVLGVFVGAGVAGILGPGGKKGLLQVEGEIEGITHGLKGSTDGRAVC